MVVKKAISLLSGLGETTLLVGVSACKKTIKKTGTLLIYRPAEKTVDTILSVLKSQCGIITQEKMMHFKETKYKKGIQREFCARTVDYPFPPIAYSVFIVEHNYMMIFCVQGLKNRQQRSLKQLSVF